MRVTDIAKSYLLTSSRILGILLVNIFSRNNKVANTKSAKKRVVQSEQRRKNNASLKSKYRTHIKKVIMAVKKNNKEEATKTLKEAIPVIDKMSTKKILAKNTAARYKSRLNTKVKKLA